MTVDEISSQLTAGFIQPGRTYYRYGEEQVGGKGGGAEKENGTCLASCSPTMISFHFNACTPIIATLKRLENGQQVGNHVCILDFAIRRMKMKQFYGE